MCLFVWMKQTQGSHVVFVALCRRTIDIRSWCSPECSRQTSSSFSQSTAPTAAARFLSTSTAEIRSCSKYTELHPDPWLSPANIYFVSVGPVTDHRSRAQTLLCCFLISHLLISISKQNRKKKRITNYHSLSSSAIFHLPPPRALRLLCLPPAPPFAFKMLCKTVGCCWGNENKMLQVAVAVQNTQIFNMKHAAHTREHTFVMKYIGVRLVYEYYT